MDEKESGGKQTSYKAVRISPKSSCERKGKRKAKWVREDNMNYLADIRKSTSPKL